MSLPHGNELEVQAEKIGQELAQTLFDDCRDNEEIDTDNYENWLIRTASNCTTDNLRSDDYTYAFATLEDLIGHRPDDEDFGEWFSGVKRSFLCTLQSLCRTECEERSLNYYSTPNYFKKNIIDFCKGSKP